MALELAELAAGLPVAVSFAMAGGITAFREGRRRALLNEAMHELRRPLQALALSLPEESANADGLHSSLRMAAVAVDRLDREINGRPPLTMAGPTPARPLVEAAVRRWRDRASLVGRCLNVHWEAGAVAVRSGVDELNQAVDNLISNGLEHGCGEVRIEVRAVGRFLHLVVVNPVEVGTGARRRTGQGLRMRASGRSRHGHGLRVVRRLAADCGGSFRLRCLGDRFEARLELPLAGVDR